MNWKTAACVGLAATACVLAPASAVAAPTRTGEHLDFTCGDAGVHILLTPGSGNKSWSVDEQNATDGTTYHVKEFEVRVYDGLHDVEPPATARLWTWSHAYGQRNGQGAPVTCEASFYGFGNTKTLYYTVVATVRP